MLPAVLMVPATSGTDWGTAWIGLGGVLIGGLITGGFSLAVALRKERADADAERRRHKVEVRRAARLIEADFHFAAAAARQALEHNEWWAKEWQPSTAAWRQYRDVVATELGETPWQTVRVAAMVLGDLRSVRDRAAKIHHARVATDPATAATVAAATALDLEIYERPPLTEDLVAAIERSVIDLEAGRAALALLIKDETTT